MNAPKTNRLDTPLLPLCSHPHRQDSGASSGNTPTSVSLSHHHSFSCHLHRIYSIGGVGDLLFGTEKREKAHYYTAIGCDNGFEVAKR